ncbi:MAG: hypothetical protein ABJD53_12540 [Gammaproteobacteria bacterium]
MAAAGGGLVVGDRAREHSGVREEKFAAWRKHSGNLAEDLKAITDVQDYVHGHNSTEGFIGERQGCVYVGLTDGQLFLHSEGLRSSTRRVDRGTTHVQPGPTAADRL